MRPHTFNRPICFATFLCLSTMILFYRPVHSQNLVQNARNLNPDEAKTRIGQSVINLGPFFDANDQTEYIAFGEPEAPGGGAIWIGEIDEEGNLSTKTPLIRIPQDPAELDGLEEGDEFGYSIALLEDLDQNGIPELAVSAIRDSEDGTNAGAVWILHLSKAGSIDLSYKFTEDDFGGPAVSLSRRLGVGVAGVRGISPENQSVLLASNELNITYGCKINKGELSGCTSHTVADSETDDIDFGHAMVAFRPDGDDASIVAIGAPRYFEPGDIPLRSISGRIYFFRVRNNNNIQFSARGTYTSSRNNTIGASLAATGDFDGDGCEDLIAGAPQFNTGGFVPGSIYFLSIRCGNSGLDANAEYFQRLELLESNSMVLRGGTSVALIQPPGKDNFNLLVGTPRADGAGPDRGAIQHLTLYNPLPPFARDDGIFLNEDTPMAFSNLFNNDQLNNLTPNEALWAFASTFGTMEPRQAPVDSVFIYTPPPDFNGELSIPYRLLDNRSQGGTSIRPLTLGRVTVTVSPVEDAPRIGSLDTLIAPIGQLYDQTVLTQEVDGDSMTVSVIKKPDWLATAQSGFSAETQTQFLGTPSASEVGDHEVILLAEDGKGTSTKSFIITVPANTLATPSLLEPQNEATEQPLQVTASWSTIEGATSYIVEYTPRPDFSGEVVQETVNSTEFTFTNLEPATEYLWRVQAKGNQAMSVFSAPYSFTTEGSPANILSAPILLFPEDGAIEAPLSLNVLWDAVEGASSYIVQRSLLSDFSGELIQQTVNETQATFDNLEPETEYFWRVQALGGAIASTFTTPFSFTTTAISNVSSEEYVIPLENGLEQNFPNPFNHSTSIFYQIETAGQVDLSIIDVQGRIIRTLVDQVQPAGRYQENIDMSHLPNGVYFYRLVTRDFESTRSMIVMQ